jgi:hypothetical protein
MRIEKNDTLTFLFWANFAAFAVHVMDETLMGGGFVAFIQQHFWTGFALDDFFQANGIWLILIAISNILYDCLGNSIVVVPLAFLWERSFNTLFHVGTTFYFRQYSPGLLSGLVFFVLIYLVCRFGLLRKQFRLRAFLGSGIVALAFEAVFISSMWWAH